MKILLAVTFCSLFFAGFSGCKKGSRESIEEQKITETEGKEYAQKITPVKRESMRELPIDFSLLGLDEKTYTLSAEKGKVMIVDFWATWCAPCRIEIPVLNSLAREFSSGGLIVWGIGLDRESVLRDFREQIEIAYPVLIGTREVADKYGIRSIPTTYMIDKEGRIAFKHVGFAPPMEAQFRRQVEQLLAE